MYLQFCERIFVMKKILISLLVLAILCAAFVSCTGNANDTGTGTDTDTTPSDVTGSDTAPATQEPDESSTLEVGVDTDDKFGPIQK